MLKPGTPAPSFEAKLTTTDEVFRFEDVRHRFVLVLYFYPKDFTYGCSREACSFRDHFECNRGLGAIILGVSPNPLRVIDNSHVNTGWPFPLISDPHHELAKIYVASHLNDW